MTNTPGDCDILIAGGGPVGAALALALRGSGLKLRLVEPAERPSETLRPIALSHGSRLTLERFGAFDAAASTPITAIHVSQAGGFGRTCMRQSDLDLPALGYVYDLGALAAGLKRCAADEHHVGRVSHWEASNDAVNVTLEDRTTCTARLLILADGGQRAGDDLALRDYDQAAVVGLVRTEAAPDGCAWERFTPEGPLALLPYENQYALVWTVERRAAAPLLELPETAFLARLQQDFGDRLGRFLSVKSRASVPLQLRYRRDPVVAARTLIVGNAAQTLHPVAGQGLNLGLRDAQELAQLIRSTPLERLGDGAFLDAYRRQRQRDRSATIGLTDTLIRVFSNDDPVMRTARGLALTTLDLLPPARRFFARRMIYGLRALP